MPTTCSPSPPNTALKSLPRNGRDGRGHGKRRSARRNYGFLVNNATGEILRMAPLFDHNMACLPMMMEMDDFDEYIRLIGRRSGNRLHRHRTRLMTPGIRAKLVDLKDFEYEDPGFDYPKWKLDAVNKLKNVQIEALLT